MKNFRICLLVNILLLCVSCSNNEILKSDEFLIEGEISGIDNKTVIELYRWGGDAGSRLATVKVKNGRFVLKEKTVTDLERLTIMSNGNGFPNMSLGVWVMPGTRIEIKGTGKQIPAWEVISSVPYQIEENCYTEKSRDIITENSRLAAEIVDLRKKRNAASEIEALVYRNAIDSLETIRKSLTIKENYANMEIMEKTDVSPVWIDKLYGVTARFSRPDYYAEYANDIRKKAEELYKRLSEEEKTTPIGYKITSSLFPPDIVDIGDDMADADLLDVDGNTKHISEYLGKYLLLDFWMSSCGPCIMALPEMKEISEIYSDKLTIISISLDVGAVWEKSLTEHNMPWVNFRDPKGAGGLAANYGVYGIPYYILISPDGKVVAKGSGYVKGALKSNASEYIK